MVISHIIFVVLIIQSMKKETTIDSHIKLLKDIIAITVGILTIISISIAIGISFGRNSITFEKNQSDKQSTHQVAK